MGRVASDDVRCAGITPPHGKYGHAKRCQRSGCVPVNGKIYCTTHSPAKASEQLAMFHAAMRLVFAAARKEEKRLLKLVQDERRDLAAKARRGRA